MKRIKTIYDLVVFAYMQICGRNENKYIKEYRRYKKNNIGNYLSVIMINFKELLNETLTIMEFVEEIEKYDDDLLKIFCVHFLYEFDNVFKEKENYPIFIKPNRLQPVEQYENKNNISQEYVFYPLAQNNFMIRSNVIVKNKMRHHRIRTGIWESISSFVVVQVNENSQKVILKTYNDKKSICEYINNNEKFKFAIVPVSNENWFKVNENGESFTIDYTSTNDKIMNDSYIKVIESLDKENVNVVIFPELAINDNTIGVVSKFLSYSCIDSSINNIKLVFLGSHWANNKNTCTLLSATGSVLLENEKKNPFELNGKDGMPIIEELDEMPENVNLIDIEGLARIYYVICKDCLDNKQMEEMYNDFGVNMSVVSAFSNSISDFETKAEYFSKNYMGITLLSNSCAVRKNVDGHLVDIGFVSFPVCEKATRKVNNRYKKYKCGDNNKMCKYCKCAKTYEVKLNEEEHDDINVGTRIEEGNINI